MTAPVGSNRVFAVILSRVPNGTLFSAAENPSARRRAFMFGDWDILEVFDECGATPTTDFAHGDRRVIYALGPLASSDPPEFCFGAVSDSPVLVFIEARASDDLVRSRGRQAIEIAAQAIHDCLKQELQAPRVSILAGLGHSDVVALVRCSSLDAVERAILALRATPAPSSADSADAPGGVGLIVRSTYSAFGFVTSGEPAIDGMLASLPETPTDVRPTTFLCLRPGAEAGLAQLVASFPQGHVKAWVQPGIFDAVLQYAPGALAAPVTQRHLLRQVMDVYRWIDRSDWDGVVHVHTDWQWPLEKKERADVPPPGRPSPAAGRMATDLERLRGILGNRLRIVEAVAERCRFFSNQSAFEPYVQPIHDFLEDLIAALPSTIPSRQLSEFQITIERIVRRISLLLLQATSGSSHGRQPVFAVEESAALPKVSRALSRLCDIVDRNVADGQSRKKVHRLVSLAWIGDGRTTTLAVPVPASRSASNVFVLHELTICRGLGRTIVELLHELAHPIDIQLEDPERLAAASLADAARILAELLVREGLVGGPDPLTAGSPAGDPAALGAELLDILRQDALSTGSGSIAAGLVPVLTALGGVAYNVQLLVRLAQDRDSSGGSRVTLDDAVRIEKVALTIRRKVSEMQDALRECRADLVAATICGWRAYLEHVEAMRGRSREYRILLDVCQQLDGSAPTESPEWVHLVGALTDWARRLMEHIDGVEDPDFRRVLDFTREQAGGESIWLAPHAVESLLELWGGEMTRRNS